MSKPFKCQFIPIPQEILKAEIKPNAKLMYGVILSMYNSCKIVNCGDEWLGEAIGVGKGAANKLVAELEKAGYIKTSLRGRVRTIFPTIKTSNKTE